MAGFFSELLGKELLEQVIAMCRIYEFEISGSLGTIPLFISPNTFLPDDWTRTLIEGLESLPRAVILNKTVVEIGVGSGILPISIHKFGGIFSNYIGYDIDTLAARVASINLAYHRLSNLAKVRGGGSIFESERGLVFDQYPYADLIIANVPQVPSLSTGPIRDQFDYYCMPVTLTGEDATWAMQGLWLVAQILQQSKERLLPGGSVIVNVGGRPTLDHIESMFSSIGYTAKVIRIRSGVGTAHLEVQPC